MAVVALAAMSAARIAEENGNRKSDDERAADRSSTRTGTVVPDMVSALRGAPSCQDIPETGCRALINATAVFGIWIAQGKTYRSMTGIDIPAHDHYFFAIAIGEVLVSLGIGFLIAFELRRKSLREKDG